MRLGLIFTGGDSTVHELATIAGQAASRSGEVLKTPHLFYDKLKQSLRPTID